MQVIKIHPKIRDAILFDYLSQSIQLLQLAKRSTKLKTSKEQKFSTLAFKQNSFYKGVR